jgi:hypothetical protein
LILIVVSLLMPCIASIVASSRPPHFFLSHPPFFSLSSHWTFCPFTFISLRLIQSLSLPHSSFSSLRLSSAACLIWAVVNASVSRLATHSGGLCPLSPLLPSRTRASAHLIPSLFSSCSALPLVPTHFSHSAMGGGLRSSFSLSMSTSSRWTSPEHCLSLASFPTAWPLPLRGCLECSITELPGGCGCGLLAVTAATRM